MWNNWPFSTILRFSDPLRSPIYYQYCIFNGSYYLKSLHKLVQPENVLNTLIFEVKIYIMCPKCEIIGHFQLFSDHLTPSTKAQYITNKVHSGAHIVPIVSTNQYYQKICSLLALMYFKKIQKVLNNRISGHFKQFWALLPHLKTTMYYQQITFKGSNSPKSLQKFILPENTFKINFLKWKCS